MTADYLRETAALMRRRASNATIGLSEEYVSGAIRHIARNVDTDQFVVEDHMDTKYGPDWATWDRYDDAEHIWSWDPATAVAVANLLEVVAGFLDAAPESQIVADTLAIAKAYRRES